jgi:Tol biopolymer transport system component
MQKTNKIMGAIIFLTVFTLSLGFTSCGEDSSNEPDVDPDFDFTGDLIAFRSDRDGNNDIWLMTPDGGEFINITGHPANDSDPAWSPDGSRIAFVSTRAGNADLWIMNVDGTGLTQVTNNQGSVRFPNWSPDGNTIAYSASLNDQRDIYVINAPNANMKQGMKYSATDDEPIQVTNDPAVDNEPVWSPDGLTIFFFSNRDGHGAIFSVGFDGTTATGDPVKLTIDLVFSCAPGLGWSLMDGRVKLSYVSEEDGSLDIWVMDLDGSNRRNVTKSQADDFYSTWMSNASNPTVINEPGSSSPSSVMNGQSRLIFDTNRDGQWELYSIGEDGTDVVRLTNHPAADEIPKSRP